MAVALVLAGTAPATALTLRGRVYTEKPGTQVTLQVWAQWEALRANPKLVDAPLASVQVASGEAFALEVPNATPPLDIEAMATGHVGACFVLTLADEATLPTVWLPAGRELRVRVTRDGKPETGVAVEGYLTRSGTGDTGYGFWCPYLPSQRTDGSGFVTWWTPASGSFGSVAVGRDGRWGRIDRTLPVRTPVELRLASRAVPVKVVDERGQPVPGIEVAGAAAPEGTAVVTGKDGGATLQVFLAREGSISAWSEARSGRTLARPDAAGPIVITTAANGTLEVSWTGPPRVLLVPGWIPNAIGRGRLIWASGGRARLPWSDGGGQVQAWAPGWTMSSVAVQNADPPVVLTLTAGVRVEGAVQDGEQHPLAGVPVWGYLPQSWGMPGSRPSADRLVLPILAWGVSDANGRFSLPPIPAGFVRLRATRAGFPAVQHGPVAAAAGSQVRATLTFKPGTTLAVRVQDLEGAALSGVTVWAFAREAGERPGVYRPEPAALRSREPAASATTGADGKAALTALAAGKAWVLLHLAGYVPRVLDAEVPPDGGDLGTQVLRPGVEVKGRVVDEAGAGLADADVSLGVLPDAAGGAAGRSDGEGRFAIPDLPRDGEVYLLARCRGFVMAAPAKVALPPAGEVVLRMDRARVLTGKVVDAETQAAVKGASVVAMSIVERASGAAAGIMYSSQATARGGTDDRGEFRLEGLSPREYDFWVRAPHYQTYQQRVQLPADGEAQPLTIALKRGLVVRGRVLDAAGQPAPGVQVMGRAAAAAIDATLGMRLGSTFGSARSGPDGTFVVDGLEPGKYEVRARADDGGSGRVFAQAGGEDVVVRLERSGAVQGRVKNADAAPAAGARVQMFGSAQYSGEATTDEAGAFALEEVPPGEYYVYVQARAASGRPQQVKVEAGRTATVEITLDATGTVVGTVSGLSAAELDACEIYADGSTARPAADGSFRLEGVREGAGHVRAVLRGGRQRAVPVEVKAGETATVEIDFGRGVTIEGTVTRSAGPVVMLVVNASAAGGLGTATTDAAGAFTIAAVPAGDVEVTVNELSGRRLLTRRVNVQSDTTLGLEVPVGEVSGRVLAARDRSPIPGAVVKVRRDGETEYLRAVTTDSSGAFTCRELEAGAYRLQASASGFAGAEAVVTVGEGGAAETTFLLEPDQGVDITVRAAGGAPPSTVYVQLFRGELLQAQLWLACDADGRARLSGVAPGAYAALFMVQGIAVVPVAVPGPAITVQLREPAALTVVTPVVESGAPWRVRVTDAQSGLPAPLWLAGLGGGVRLGWVEARDGRTIAGVAAGTFLVEAVAPDGGARQTTVTLAPKAVQTVRFQ